MFFQFSFVSQRKSKEIFREKRRGLGVRITEMIKIGERERGSMKTKEDTKKNMGDEMR